MARKRKATGLGLMDVLVATAVTGIGVVATVCAVGESCLPVADAQQEQVAVNLAQQIHEFALTLPHSNPDGTLGMRTSSNPATFNDLYDLHGWTSAAAIDSAASAIDGYADWQQSVQVFGVDPDNPQANLAAPTRMGLKRVVATVLYRGTPVHSESWFLAPTPR